MTKAKLVGTVAIALVALDGITKWIVQRSFDLGESLPVAGDVLRFTYVLNPGAAFGLSVGPWSRQIFGLLAVVAAVVILAIIRATPASDRSRLAALAMILGGAMGNLVDRVRHPGGVVDFLDVGLAGFRWPVFNVADVGVTTGAALLVLLLWDEEMEATGDAAGQRAGAPSADGSAASAGGSAAAGD